MSSANAFNFDHSKILFLGKELTCTPHNIPSKPLAAFPYNHCQNSERGRNPVTMTIIGMNISQARDQTINPLFSSSELKGLAILSFEKKSSEMIVEMQENAAFSLFLTIFSTLLKKENVILTQFIRSSVNAFNLLSVWSNKRFLSFGKQ